MTDQCIEYYETPLIRKIRNMHPEDVKVSTEAEVRDKFEKQGYEVVIANDGSVTIRKVTKHPWRHVGFVDEFLQITGPAAEMLRRHRTIQAVRTRRTRRERQANADAKTGHV